MLYQICTLSHAQGEKKPFVTSVKTVCTDSQASAYAHAYAIYGDNADIIVYPYCTATDGNAQTELALYTVRSYEKWERRNNSAVMNPFNRGYHDREDYVSIAILAINTLFASKPNANMHDLKTFAFSAISREQTRQGRISEREYHPDFHMDSIRGTRAIKATYPELVNLIKEAIRECDMGQEQAQVLNMSIVGRKSLREIAEIRGTTKTPVEKLLNKAKAKVLEYAVTKDLTAFERAGFDPGEVMEMVELYNNKVKKSKKTK